MKISVLMSTYNGQQYIVDQLDSLLHQTRTIDELVIVDDCSTDNTVDVVKQYIADHNLESCWKVYVNACNVGWRVNFIQGIQKITGDILLFSDQDDIWLKNKVEIITNVLLHNPDIHVAASNETIWTGESVADLYIPSGVYSKKELSRFGKNYFICCSGCTMAIRKTYIDQVMPYHRNGWAHDDFFWKTSVIDGVFALVEASTILHRIHGGNESRKKRTLSSTITGLEIEETITNQLIAYIDNAEKENRPITNTKAKLWQITHKRDGNLIRKKYFQTGNPLLLIKLGLGYLDIYRRKRQIIKDFMLLQNTSR